MTDTSPFDNLQHQLLGLLVGHPALHHQAERIFESFRATHQGKRVLIPRRITEQESARLKELVDAGYSVSYACRLLNLPQNGIVRQRAGFLP
ncbi:hypothetical protein ABZN20_10100 [Methylococcus sp. ANG]|uniref:hypothetical protein n=1 Tax=Methylococcus sp. ANG TaxID=3231903 RepID=UPI003459BBF6